MRILVAPDKFKASLSASEAAEAIRNGLAEALPDASIRCVPLADGGEGTVQVFTDALGGSLIEANAHDALGRPIRAIYGWNDAQKLAVIEMSAASGLWRIPGAERDPWRASTLGTGELIRDAIQRGARRILVGLGGSATSDAGAGMAAALGVQFLDAAGAALDPVPVNFPNIARVVPSSLSFPEIFALSDVDNPLLGPQGAAHVFGPQKGVTDPAALDDVLRHFADVVTRDVGSDFREIPGAGAAGGLGFGLLSFCQATIRSGFDELSALLDLPGLVRESDLVITAEGSLDPQTLGGKGPAGIARLARDAGRPVFAMAGVLRDEDRLHEIFDACLAIADRPMSAEESMHDAQSLLTRAARRLGRMISATQRM